MALPASGPISMQDLQDEYGGGHPINIVEYYRGGSYVKTQETVTTNDYTRYIVGEDYWYWDTNNGIEGVYLNGVLDNSFAENTVSQYYTPVGNSKYYVAFGGGSSQGEFPAGVFYYNVRTFTETTNQLNTSVPTSGTISLDDFHGQGN